MQLAIYAFAANTLWASSEATAAKVDSAAYIYPEAGYKSRAFDGKGEVENLLAAGRDWLELVASLIQDRSFPRTTKEKDCKYCQFLKVCGLKAHSAAEEKLTGANAVPLQDFLKFKDKPAEGKGS